jgi:hypothetical protein
VALIEKGVEGLTGPKAVEDYLVADAEAASPFLEVG